MSLFWEAVAAPMASSLFRRVLVFSLSPQTGTGTITYNFLDTDKNATVQIVCNNGIVETSILSFGSSGTEENTKVSEIYLLSTNVTKIGINSVTLSTR